IAWQLQKERKLAEASDEFEAMYRIDPENEEIHANHAELLRDMGDKEQAALRLCELARLLSRKGDDDRDLTTLKKLLVFDSDNSEARRQIIMISARRGDVAVAVREMQALVHQLLDDGDRQGALAATRDAIALDEKNVELHESLLSQLDGAG